MKKIIRFHQALKAAIDRAAARHKSATGKTLILRRIAEDTGKTLILRRIAEDTGIDLSALLLALRGERSLGTSQLLPLLVYLGCDEEEQRVLFHLAEFASVQIDNKDVDFVTDELPATSFAALETEPGLERITEPHRAV